MTSYAEFLAAKTSRIELPGRIVAAGDVHPSLHPWQNELVQWAVRTSRAALWADTGMGKTRMQLEWARLSGNALIVAPLAVCAQTVREAANIGIPAYYARSGDEVSHRFGDIPITNYERLQAFHPDSFDAVVLDECFAAGTEVDTPGGPVPIERLRIGDQVNCASGTSTIWDVHRREVPYAVAIKSKGRETVCSPNHPWFTQRGWVCAQDIEPGDCLVDTSEAVRMVRSDVHQVIGASAEDQSFLRAVLLSEMADEPTRVCGATAHTGGSRQARREAFRAPQVRIHAGTFGTGSHPKPESHVSTRGSSEGLPPIEGDEPSTFRAWGKWTGDDGTATDDAGNTGRFVAGGAVCVTGQADSGLSHSLQARLSERRAESRYRAGWSVPSLTEGSRPQEGREAGFTRVDGLEILESGDPRLDQFRDASGKLYFYDLGVEGHPSYSVNGHLVHNSSILKQSDGKTRSMLIDWAKDVPHRLACSATPAPNDPEELTNQAEWLGRMTRTHMLASYFIHDNDGWRLKGHARQPMMQWMSQWAVALTKPSDAGGDDTGYQLPGLEVIPELVAADVHAEGQLFATDIGGVAGRAELRRNTLRARVERAAELVAAEADEPWLLWCGLNSEADALAAAIPGAVNVHGSLDPDEKAQLLLDFADGKYRVLVTKPQIASLGMNWQHCARMAFVGLGDSYEQYYQAIRRCYRYGQTRIVRAHVVLSELESQIAANVARKEKQASEITQELVAQMRRNRNVA